MSLSRRRVGDGGVEQQEGAALVGAQHGLGGEALALALGRLADRGLIAAHIALGLGVEVAVGHHPPRQPADRSGGQAAHHVATGGRLAGELAFRHDAQEFSGHGRIEIVGANAGAILKSGANAVDGQLTVKLQGDSLGLSPEGLIGSLHGSGTMTLSNAHFAGLDPAAFDAAARAADLSATIETPKIRAAVSAAIDNSRLAVPQGAADVTITGGQIRLAKTTLQAQQRAELSVAGLLDLNTAAIDARMGLSGQPAANALIDARPRVGIRGSRVAFLHPRATAGVLTEIVEPAAGLGAH